MKWESPEKKRWRDGGDENLNIPSEHNYRVLLQLMVCFFTQLFLCSCSSLSCGQLAAETDYCGSYRPHVDGISLSLTLSWVALNVWGGKTPQGWRCSKTSPKHRRHLDNLISLFFQSIFSFFCPALFSLSDSKFITSMSHKLWATPITASYFSVKAGAGTVCGFQRISLQRQKGTQRWGGRLTEHFWNQPHPLSGLQTKGGIRKSMYRCNNRLTQPCSCVCCWHHWFLFSIHESNARKSI